MKSRLQNYIRMLPLCLLIAVMAYFSWKFVFYEFSEDAAGYTLQTAENGADEDYGLYFTYDNTDISLNLGGEMDKDDIQFYGMTSEGIAVMSEEHTSRLTPDYSGSFFAVSKLQYADYDGNGSRDRLHIAARTDLEFSQSNDTDACLYGSGVFPLEVSFNRREEVQLYYNDEPLSDAKVRLRDYTGAAYVFLTDDNGVLSMLTAKDAWRGFTVFYTENGQDYYILSYCAEENTLFTLRHLQAMTPFFIILAIAAAGILSVIFARRALEKRAYGADYVRRKHRGRKTAALPFSLFTVIRWSCMLAAWILVFYGGHIFGRWFDNVAFPILSCGLENESQLVSGSCYYLANLDLLLGRSPGEIVAFFMTFAVSLILLGRTICGFLCPMGLLQDVIHGVRQALCAEGIPFSEKMYDALRPVKWVFVILMLSLCFAGGKFCDICPAQTLSPAFSGFKVSLYVSGFMMVVVVVGSFFKRRFWCNICPLGFLMGAAHRLSLFQLRKECTACTGCGACYEACPMGIKRVYTEREREKLTDWDCIMCGECVRRCPEDRALSITFCGMRIYTSSRARVMRRFKKDRKKGKSHDGSTIA